MGGERGEGSGREPLEGEALVFPSQEIFTKTNLLVNDREA